MNHLKCPTDLLICSRAAIQCCHDVTTQPLTSAVRDGAAPASRLQAAEARRADQLVSAVAAENNLTVHQKAAAVSVTKFWRPGVHTLHWRWW